VGNAIKFTEAGEIVVRAHGKAVGQQFVLHVAVSDTGQGIPADKLGPICTSSASSYVEMLWNVL
jgi:signal transduction histidine kinase